MMKPDVEVLAQSKFYPSAYEEETDVAGRFVKYRLPHAFKSRLAARVVTQDVVHCEVKITRQDNKDLYSYRLKENDAKSAQMKERFAAAWEAFGELVSHPETLGREVVGSSDDIVIAERSAAAAHETKEPAQHPRKSRVRTEKK